MPDWAIESTSQAFTSFYHHKKYKIQYVFPSRSGSDISPDEMHNANLGPCSVAAASSLADLSLSFFMGHTERKTTRGTLIIQDLICRRTSAHITTDFIN